MTELAPHYDVVCIGGAMMGSATAYFLTENPDFDGTVLVVEPDWTYDRAATTRAQNSIREQFTNELNIRLSGFGVDFIADFHENVQVDGDAPEINFRGTGYLFLADTEELYERLERESEVQLAAGAEVEMLRPADIAERFPYMDADQLSGARLGGMREGSFDGWAFFQGLRQRARHNGAVYVKDRVVDLDVAGGRVVRVHLESGRSVACGHAVNTSGCRARQVAAMAGVELPIEPRARTSFVFDCRTPIPHTVPLTITPVGVHFRREQNHYMCGGVPEHDVAVDYDDLEVRYDEFEELIWPAVARYVPCFDEIGVVTSWGGQYDYNTLDHNLIIGASSAVENLIFANGFSGHGLQQGPAVGRGISELITYGGYRTIDLSPLGYSRIERNEPIVEHAVI
ncbi:NAD(P)/FAD-dependent oxidoreductase [Ilumatobacter sp.]|uniref:NAD(P)/FAD-dependent oxidoreductase n=1 Tax=Ilumatobacter sp. TaxID=1967498 RepID=UPI003C47D1B8